MKRILQQIVLILIGIALTVVVVIGVWPTKVVSHPPGELCNGAPTIAGLRRPAVVKKNGYELETLARIKLVGRVLQRRNFYDILSLEMFSFDREARVSPVSIMIGWDEMSDESVLEEFSFFIEGRESRWKPDDINQRLVVKPMVEDNTALIHLIPESPSIEKQFEELYIGTLVTIDGMVVKVSDTESPFQWGTDELSTEEAARDRIVLVKSISCKNGTI